MKKSLIAIGILVVIFLVLTLAFIGVWLSAGDKHWELLIAGFTVLCAAAIGWGVQRFVITKKKRTRFALSTADRENELLIGDDDRNDIPKAPIRSVEYKLDLDRMPLVNDAEKLQYKKMNIIPDSARSNQYEPIIDPVIEDGEQNPVSFSVEIPTRGLQAPMVNTPATIPPGGK